MNYKPTVFTIVLLLCSATLLSQEAVCEGSPCTSNDFTIDYFYLGDENGEAYGPGYCEPGNTVEAHLWINFTANSAANRYNLYLHFNLFLNGEFIGAIDECFYDGQPIPTNVTLDTYTFSWECGAEVVLQDLYMSWQTNDHGSCDCAQSHCYSNPTVVVDAPLIANFDFNPSCLSAFTVDFESTTSGGTEPYTYLWEFGDGATSTEENPTHTYTSNGPYNVTLTVFDADNTDSYNFEILNFDSYMPPEITAPENLDLEGCDVNAISQFGYSETPIVLTESEFLDLGGSLVLTNDLVSITYSDTTSGNCPTVVTRTFTVQDACDNNASDVQVITISDSILPTATSPSPINVQCIDEVPAPDVNIVTDEADNCSVPVVAFVSDVSDNQSCPETITRTYSVTDACNNSILVTQIIAVHDDVPPTAANPSPITVQCIDDVPAPDVNVVTDEADNCSVPVVAFVSEISDTAICPQTITRTYSITDACNNSIIVTQGIIINDDVAPTASNPSPITVQCTDDVPAPDVNVVTDEADNCSVPVVAFVSDASDNQSCPQTITRTYSVTDACNNSINVTQTIIINDDILPTGSNPAPIYLECGEAIPPPDINDVTDEADNCSTPSVTFVSDISNGECPETIIRTFEITDQCNNSILVTQDIIYADTTGPVLLSTLEDETVSCSNIPDTPVLEFEDDCSTNLTVTYSESSTNENNTVDYIITREWIVSDDCGNESIFNQLINVIIDDCLVYTCNSCGTEDDTIAPTASNPPDLIVDCSESIPLPDVNVVVDESDNCITPAVTFISEVISIDCLEKITRTYRVADECGNYIDVTHNIIVVDNELPTASNPADINVTCSDDIPSPDVNVVTDEADNCSTPTVTFVSDVSNDECFEKIIRTYRITDHCGNYIDVKQLINVNDDIPPTASNPETISVQCISDVPTPDVNVVTDEADNCSVPVVAFVSDVSDNQSCPETITRTFSVTDACNNSIHVTQTIAVHDDVPPTASNPSQITVQCIGDVPSPDVNVVTDEADNCSVPTITFISDVSDNQSCQETITRTYRVSDACGNSLDVTQNIVINDDTAPTASNPVNVNLSCTDNIPAPDISVVNDATDNCSTPVVTFVSEVSDNQSCIETIIRTYRVTDACGNSIDVTQNILINDDIAPTASNPLAINLSCTDNIPAPDISVVNDSTDNCSTPVVTFVSDVSDDQSCLETITRTYRVSDACGNSIDVTQSIHIVDDIAPQIISEFDNEIYITCEEVPQIPQLEFADNCDQDVDIQFSETMNQINDLNFDIHRTWIVTDECNNQNTFNQTIYVNRNTESNTQYVDLCAQDEPLHIFGLIPYTEMVNTNSLISEWDSNSMDLIANGYFDPGNVELGEYTFLNRITNNDCTWTTTINVRVNDDCVYYSCVESEADVTISKMVTPNNDGFNDFFEVFYVLNEASNEVCDIAVKVEIYNRWGTKVFQSNNYNNDWAGVANSTAANNSNYLPTGTYYYIVELINGGLKPIQGFIYLGTE